MRLEDLYKGKTTKLQLTKSVLCSQCNGKGAQKDAQVKQCDSCGGHGIKLVVRQLAPGMVQQMQTTCPECRGEGEIIRDKDRCPKCKGEKTIQEKKVLEVNIEKGMQHGQKITFRGEADQKPGLTPGDIIIVLQQVENQQFRRDGHDLWMEHTINLIEALCGFEFLITHLDGRKLVVKSAAGDVIKPGSVKCIPGEGFPIHKRPFDKGRLFIKFTVEFPAPGTVSAAQAQQLEKIIPTMTRTQPKYNPAEVDEYELKEVDPHDDARYRDARSEAYHEDDEHGQPQSNCHVGAQ